MIKSEHISDEVEAAFKKAWLDERLTVKDALAAALSAWPGMRELKQGPFGITYDIILPLQEKTDGK